MNYEKIYNNLVLTRSKLNRVKGKKEYFENHHILPKCLGGTNDKSNLILLTPREHYIAHCLLTKIYPNSVQLVYAIWRLSHNGTNGYTLNSTEYNNIKYKISEIHSSRMTGTNNPMFGIKGINHPRFGKKHTNETKVKISRANIGKNYGHAGKNHSWFGKTHSKESKLKMSNSKLGPNNRLYGSEPWENPKTINSNTSKNWYHLDIIYDIWKINNTLGYVNFYNLVLSIYPSLTKSKTSFKNIRLWFIKNGNPRTYERWKHWKNNNKRIYND